MSYGGIKYLGDGPAPKGPIILYERESGYYKHWREYLKRQRKAIRRKIKNPVYKAFKEIASGRDYHRPKLKKAVALSQKTGYPIVSLNIDRLLRHQTYHAIRNPVLPTKSERKEFLALYPGVEFILVEKDEEIRSNRTKRGQKATGNKGGGDHTPGNKRRKRQRLKEKAQALRAKGISYREIARQLKIPVQTAYRWGKAV